MKGELKLEVRGNVNFLTDFPQLNHFNVAYKRHTNFATEMIYQDLDGSREFGEELSIIMSRTGDLIHKQYVVLTLSEVNIPRKTNISGISRGDAITNYNSFLSFLDLLYPVYRKILDEEENINFNISDIINILDTIANTKEYTDIQGTTVYNNFYGEKFDFVNEYKNLNDPYDAFDDTTGKLNLNTFINFIISTTYYDKVLFNLTKEFGTKTNYYFAWKKNIGHLLLKQIDLEIGGQKIDRQYTDWLNIWSELTIDSNMRPTYDKMIGNIDILTTYDSNIKPQYQLLIPLQFFYNRYLECALPIIFFRYHDVKITIKINDLYSVAQVDPQLAIDNVNIDEYVKIVNAQLLTEYIYLDEDERVKFATYAHEYLVDYVQEYNIDIINQQQTINFDFFNSVKSLYFFVKSYQSLSYNNYDYNTNIIVEGIITSQTINNKIVTIFILNENFSNQLIVDSSLIGKYVTFTNTKFYNGTYKIISTDNQQFQFDGKYEGEDTAILIYNLDGPIQGLEILFESYQRQKSLEGKYLNDIVPYKTHTCIPNIGIYQYSFSLKPEEYQPSGSCNFSALRYKSINLELTDNFWNYARYYNYNTDINKARFQMYGLTYNILRLANGMGALYFSS